MLTFQFINKSYRPFLSKNVLLQKVGIKFYKVRDLDPVTNRLDPHHSVLELTMCLGKGQLHDIFNSRFLNQLIDPNLNPDLRRNNNGGQYC
jgi:hypothetical protein